MRIQCPECGILRQASADPCPSCGAEAPASPGGPRSGSGTSLRQWKERYQTGQLPGISPGASGIGNSSQFSRRTSGPLTSGQSNPDWNNASPSSPIPPSANLGRRTSGPLTSGPLTSGPLTPPPEPPAAGRKSASRSSALWQRATDPTPPPPSRSSGALGTPGRTSGGETGNSSASWKWRNQASTSGSLSRQLDNAGYDEQDDYQNDDQEEMPTQTTGNSSASWKWRNQASTSGSLSRQLDNAGYDEQDDYQNDDQEEMPTQTTGRRGSAMLPVPYQGGRRGWNQGGGYGDEEEGDGSNLPAPMGMQNSMGFPMDDSMLQRLAPGRKAPAFIPATRPRRPYRLSRYRILSGTLSLGLVLMAVVGGLAFLAVHSGLAARLLGGSAPLAARNYTFQQTAVPTMSGTPQATPSNNAAAEVITNVVTALHYSSTFDPITPTTNFQTGQNVNVLWKVKSAQANDVVSIIWYESGSALTADGTPNTQKTFDKAGPYNGLFALCYPMGGLGKAELYWNGQLAQTIEFVVQGNPAPCSGT